MLGRLAFDVDVAFDTEQSCRVPSGAISGINVHMPVTLTGRHHQLPVLDIAMARPNLTYWRPIFINRDICPQERRSLSWRTVGSRYTIGGLHNSRETAKVLTSVADECGVVGIDEVVHCRA